MAMQSWKSGYEATGAKMGYQLCASFSTCSLADAYLSKHCGVCNPNCALATGKSVLGDTKVGISPSDPNLVDVLANIGGLQWSVPGFAVDTAWMPKEVNLIWDNKATVPPADGFPVAISAEQLFPVTEVDGRLHCRPVADVRNRLGISPESRIWLVSGAPDRVIEWMWVNPSTTTSVLGHTRLELIMSPHVSMYGTQCPLHWRVSGKRTLIMYSEYRSVCAYSVPTISIPSVSFAEHWEGWLQENPAINCICVNTQTWKSNSQFYPMVKLLAWFASRVRTDMHYIITGPVTPDRIELVRDVLPSCTIVSSFHYNRGRLGKAA